MHLNPEFSHTWGEIKKKLAKKSTLALKGALKLEIDKTEFHPVFPFF